MTLLELLVKELDDWPEFCVAITQDKNSAITHHLVYWLFDGWVSDTDYEVCVLKTLASDYQTTAITLDQWASAKLAGVK